MGVGNNHGDRTPDVTTLYPRDPHLNETYYPIGIGQLTSKGKQRAYGFGKLLRRQYDSFLGKIYIPDILEAISTDMDRTKVSLQLVLAGLFPPAAGGDLDWDPLLNWQPIPYNYTSFKHDMWMTYAYDHCPRYSRLYNEYLEESSTMQFIKSNYTLFEYIRSNTGLSLNNPTQLWGLYSCLQSQVEWGLTLPQWTNSIFPEILERISIEVMNIHVATAELRKLSGGLMLRKIINNMKAKIDTTFTPKDMKIILYSAHDTNILYLSSVLDQDITQTIPYSSYYIIELVETDGLYKVQIYKDGSKYQEPLAVKIPGCKLQCPLKDFARLLDKYIPSDDNGCFEDR